MEPVPSMRLCAITIGGVNIWLYVACLALLLGSAYFSASEMAFTTVNQIRLRSLADTQTISILVIDKKRMKLSEAGFPQIVLDQTPKYLRRAKVPVVKAKIGPKVASLMCEEKIFDLIPVKKEVKAVMNGIYIIDVKGMRGGLDAKPEKKKLFARMKDKMQKSIDRVEKEKKKAGK